MLFSIVAPLVTVPAVVHKGSLSSSSQRRLFVTALRLAGGRCSLTVAVRAAVLVGGGEHLLMCVAFCMSSGKLRSSDIFIFQFLPISF